jgi:hypothetical protein
MSDSNFADRVLLYDTISNTENKTKFTCKDIVYTVTVKLSSPTAKNQFF